MNSIALSMPRTDSTLSYSRTRKRTGESPPKNYCHAVSATHIVHASIWVIHFFNLRFCQPTFLCNLERLDQIQPHALSRSCTCPLHPHFIFSCPSGLFENLANSPMAVLTRGAQQRKNNENASNSAITSYFQVTKAATPILRKPIAKRPSTVHKTTTVSVKGCTKIKINHWSDAALQFQEKLARYEPDDECDLRRAGNEECTSRNCTNPECTNRKLQWRHYSPYAIQAAGDKGWGMYAVTTIPKGALVIEYVGMVVTEEEAKVRLANNTSCHVYCLSMGSGTVIDAGEKGNDARFINHSCEPNCETQKLFVGTKPRVGIFAKRAIPKGEEISFDYHFEVDEANKVVCQCGAATCRGFV
ncbi:hypothetical protein J8273_8520 [Carpediemonas membranifera]|uniref:SET domain-containing protein n=1 Tax=Carpediemonas membranifera TaxID=201153 RepID=A0A8J6BU05_9EUKA|nr:hypothetical protein J8273_8520 [Carpediemonas membranifera]|eukprot:KAG9389841.1 hypothetical protein J8273_8520 [Carpediemonas membranifera]